MSETPSAPIGSIGRAGLSRRARRLQRLAAGFSRELRIWKDGSLDSADWEWERRYRAAVEQAMRSLLEASAVLEMVRIRMHQDEEDRARRLAQQPPEATRE